MPLRVEIVTAERMIYSEEGVDQVVAPGTVGEFTVLPQHSEFITALHPGELRITKGGEVEELAITGGFLEVRDDRIVVLADAVERIEEIDVARAEEARREAEEALRGQQGLAELAATQASLQRALMRLRVAEKRSRRGRPGPPRVS